MTDRVLTEALSEVATHAAAMAQVVEQRAESLSRASFGALAATVLSEALSDNDPPLQASSLLVEVLRRDTAAAAMVTDALEAFGESPWPDAKRGVFAFRHDWAEPLVERLQWATGVVRLASGNEARQALRRVPRRSITYRVGNGRESDALVADWLADHLGRTAWWPLPHYAVTLTAAASAGVQSLAVTPVDAAGFAPARAELRLEEDGLRWPAGQRFALLMAQDGWQVAGIDVVDPERLWLTEPLARPAPAGATVMPLVEGVAVESGESAQWLPGVMAGRVTAQVAFEYPPDDGLLDDPMLDGFPIWPDGNWRDDPSVTAQAVITQRDLSPADPWTRRNDPWAATVFQRRYLAVGREDIARWRARLYRAQGRLSACWIADWLAPVLRVSAPATVNDGFLRVEGDGISSFWHRPAGAMILHPDGSSQAVLTSTFHHDAGGVLVLRSGLQAPVPSGSRVIRLALCRLDHDAIDLHWHTPELVEIPLTMRLLPPTRGNDVVTSIGP